MRCKARKHAVSVTAVATLVALTTWTHTASAEIGKRKGVSLDARNGFVVVHVPGLQAHSSTPAIVNGRIEIRFEGSNDTSSTRKSYRDATIKRIAMRGGDTPRILLRLRHSRKTTRMIARATYIRNSAHGVDIVVPRKSTARGRRAADVLQTARGIIGASEPKTAQVNVAKSATKPEAAATTKPVTPLDVKGKDNDDKVAAPTEAEKPNAGSTTEAKQPVAGKSESGGIARVLGLLAVILGGSFALIWWARRKKKESGISDAIDVLASKSLGPKAKVVLVSAGEREVLLSVSDKGAELITEWDARDRSDDIEVVSETPIESEEPTPQLGRTAQRLQAALRAVSKPDERKHQRRVARVNSRRSAASPSPSVSGLLRLRDAAGESVDQERPHEADWVRELRGAKRQRNKASA